MELIDVLNHERSEFIKIKGYSPDTLYLGTELEQFDGKYILGMEIRINHILGKGQAIMCRFMDLKYPVMPECNIAK